MLHGWHDLTARAATGRRFHATCNTAGTLMLNIDVSLEVASAMLGHSGLAITADVYAKVGAELQPQEADAMECVWVRITEPSWISREASPCGAYETRGRRADRTISGSGRGRSRAAESRATTG